MPRRKMSEGIIRGVKRTFVAYRKRYRNKECEQASVAARNWAFAFNKGMSDDPMTRDLRARIEGVLAELVRDCKD